MTYTDRAGPSPRLRVTVEVALWAAITLAALFLRFANLDAAPLSQPEAREAIWAWRATGGQHSEGETASQGSSPVLLAANAFLFALVADSDVSARLFPALIGAVLVLTPWLLRTRIGRIGSLAAGAFLAISPTAVVASRQSNGAVLAALGCMLALGGWIQFVDSGRERWIVAAAVGVALCVTSSPLAYGLLAPLALACAIASWTSPDGGSPRALWETVRPRLWLGLIVFVAAAVILSTAIGWNIPGVAQAAGLLPEWLSGLGPGASESTGPASVVVLYEILILLLGTGGLIWPVRVGGIRRRRPFALLLGLWAAMGLALLWIRPAAPPIEALGVVLPLALLAGIGVEALAARLRLPHARWVVWLLVPACLILWVYAYVVLAHYAKTGRPEDIVLALLAVGLQLLLTAAFAYLVGSRAAFAGLATACVIALALATVSAGWGAAHVRPADPQEILHDRPTDSAIRDLLSTLESTSWRTTGTANGVALIYEADPDSVLAWYLRAYPSARRIDLGSAATLADEELSGSALLTVQMDTVPPSGDYVGQDFALKRAWDIGQVACSWEWPPNCQRALRWLLYRRVQPPPPPGERVILWLHETSMLD